ncbi:hypothetical protein JCM5350_006066 [Sporobolomyces pararoseus]
MPPPSASTSAPSGVRNPSGNHTEEEGEIVEAKSTHRAPISFPAKATNSNQPIRDKVSLSFKGGGLRGAISKHLEKNETGQPKKPSTHNVLNSRSTSGSKGSPALSIRGSAKDGEHSGGNGASPSAATRGSGEEAGQQVNSLGISIAGSSSLQGPAAPASINTTTEAKAEGSVSPRAVFRKRSRGSPGKSKTSATSQPSVADDALTQEAIEALKNEVVIVPSPPAPPAEQLPLMRPVIPSAASSLPLSLPPKPSHPARPSASPPERITPLPSKAMDPIDSNGGLPYDGSAGEYKQGEFGRERGYDRGTSRDDDRYASSGGHRDDGGRAWDRGKDERSRQDRDRRRNGDDRYSSDARRSRSPDHNRRQHYGDSHSRTQPHRDHRSHGKDRRDGYEDRDRSHRPSKRQRKGSVSPSRHRSRSRTPMSEDDQDTSRPTSKTPPQYKQKLSPRAVEQKRREWEEKSKSKQRSSKEEEEERQDRNGQNRRSPSFPPPPAPHIDLSLPTKPKVLPGTSVAASAHRPQERYPNGGPNLAPTETIGSYRSKMGPSTIDQPTPPSRPHPLPAFPRPPPASTTSNGNGSGPLPPPPPPPPPPGPPRPSYGSALPEEDRRLPRQEVTAPPRSSQPPMPPTTSNEDYPIPPPAPYHPGNRPTDPDDHKFESPAATKGRNTPNENSSSTLLADETFRGVRTGKGHEEPWLNPPSPSSTLLGRADGTDKAATTNEVDHQFFGASHISEYTLQQKLGEGTFGVVYKGIRGKEGATVTEEEREMENQLWKRGLRVRKGDVVALKQIIFHNEGDGLPITSVREIRILKQLDHPNVVPVVDMALDPGDHTKMQVGRTFMVFPYMDHDLAGLLENPQVKLDIGEIKQYGKQLLEGTAYLHRNGILHRDMKAANLLINNKGVLMIADFGLARSMEPPEVARDYTSCVVTRWYRPPELLLGERKYHYPVDMWGVGCILLEMFKRSPIFPGNSDLHQAQLIFAACGPPTDESMPGWRSLPGVEGFDKNQQQWKNSGRTIRADASHYDTEIFADLLDKILVLDPKRRLTADDALDHDWFWTEPFPTEPSRMREFMSSHEYDRRKLKENQHAAFGQLPPQQPPQQMVQPRPQPMPPMAFNGPPPPPPPSMMPYPPVGAYNAPPPNFNSSGMGMGMGMGPSFANNGGGGMGNYHQSQQGYGQGPPNGYVANRPPPSTLQGPAHYNHPPSGLDYGRQPQHQPSGPSWQANRLGPAAAAPGQGPGPKLNLMARLKKPPK